MTRAAFALALCISIRASAAEVERPISVSRPRLDVVFAIDTTGSMGDEIDVVKGKLRSMVSEIARGNPRPDVRFGLVAYRDRGDAYVTRPTALTRDIDAVVGAIQS